MKAIVDPCDNILYKSFYIYGLEQLLGRRNVYYNAKSFSSLSDESRNTKSIRFIIEDANKQRRFMIACDDMYQVIPELYEWCDVYGNVNANFPKTPHEYHKKLVSLCPSFAVRCWSAPTAISHAVQEMPKDLNGLRKHFGKYKRMLQRNEYSSYRSLFCSDNDYLFMCSTLWTNNEWNKVDDTVNLSRAMFIRAGRSIENLRVEGGFVPSKTSSVELFNDCLCDHVNAHEWLHKTQRSMCVFNTPAYWQCHGWKLGEYMALGKAIITTPLSNDLPHPLVHEEHIHVVENNQESMRDAILYMLNHPEYRHKLESNIVDYWQQYGTPQASLKLLGIY